MKNILLFNFLFSLLILSACSNDAKDISKDTAKDTSANENFKDYSVLETYDILKSNQDNPDIVLLDVRTPQENRLYNIKGSKYMNFISSEFQNELNKLDKNKKYIVYCQNGSRSKNTVNIMKSLGFKEAHVMRGGISQWEFEDLPYNLSR